MRSFAPDAKQDAKCKAEHLRNSLQDLCHSWAGVSGSVEAEARPAAIAVCAVKVQPSTNWADIGLADGLRFLSENFKR